MRITFRKFKFDDLHIYEKWRSDIGASRYMSNYYPNGFNGNNLGNIPYCIWSVIVVNGIDNETIWLEKTRQNSKTALLGIMIGRKTCLGKGIGRNAIAIQLTVDLTRKVFDFDVVQLNVRKSNARAITCYHQCGFTIVAEGSKVNQRGEFITYYKMSLDC